jgi:hypothetical protein
MALFGSHQRKTLGQVKTHLMTKHTHCAGAGAIFLFDSLIQHMLHQIEILLHYLLPLYIYHFPYHEILFRAAAMH